jgi:gamma-glutamyltranspeptidase
VSEWGLTAEEAAWAPRFGLPAKLGSTELRFERHYDAEVFAMLAKREIPHSRIKASSATGLVGAIVVDDEGRLHVTQDPRKGGLAKAV